MDKRELIRLAEEHQSKADAAYQHYQETGISRYANTYRKNEDLADAIRMAAAASDEHKELLGLRGVMANFFSRAASATGKFRSEEERVDLAMTLARDLAEYGRINGYIGKERF